MVLVERAVPDSLLNLFMVSKVTVLIAVWSTKIDYWVPDSLLTLLM